MATETVVLSLPSTMGTNILLCVSGSSEIASWDSERHVNKRKGMCYMWTYHLVPRPVPRHEVQEHPIAFPIEDSLGSVIELILEIFPGKDSLSNLEWVPVPNFVTRAFP